jgi:hypothetical protein
MAIHRVDLWPKGFAGTGFHLIRARNLFWPLFDTGRSGLSTGFASELLGAPVN